MVWGAWLGLLALAGQAGGEAEQVRADPYCRDIAGIVQASQRNFESLKGAWRTDDDVWVSLVTLPGADKCFIRPWTDRNVEFVCKWRVADGATAIAQARTMAEKMRMCARYTLNSDSGPLMDMTPADPRSITFLWEQSLTRTRTKLVVEASRSARLNTGSIQFRVENR